MRQLLALVVLVVTTMASVPAMADDWLVARLRGVVEIHLHGEWGPVRRGDLVPDGTEIRTGGAGRIALVRGNETVELLPNTLATIIDKDGQRFTTVKQSYGNVEVEAEVREVKHFAVQTPYMAAVVKGTRFRVSAGPEGGEVAVERGNVEVKTKIGLRTMLARGQSAEVDSSGNMSVAGIGLLPEVLTRNGKAVGFSSGANAHGQATAAEARAHGQATAAEAKGDAGSNGKAHAKDN